VGLVASCRRGEGRSSPVPNDLRSRCSHHLGAGRLGPVIPATCATVSVSTDVLARKEAYRMASLSATIPVFVPHCVGFLSSLLASSFRPARSPRSLRPGDSASKLLKGCSRLCGSPALKYAFAWGARRWPSGYDPERAWQRGQPGQPGLPPGRAGRFAGPNTSSDLHSWVFSRLGTTVRVRPASRDVMVRFPAF
jgi:hypothetical protein